MKHIERSFEIELKNRLSEKPRFIQCVLGPRQIGKTSGVRHVLETYFVKSNFHYASCDDKHADSDWIYQQFQIANEKKSEIIAIDEIQKIENWNESIKNIFDSLKKNKELKHIVLLGSSSLKISQGLSDSLAGRFEIISAYHWPYHESHKLSGISFDDYVRSGGYPESYFLLKDSDRFRNYIVDSIFESVISKDILRYAQVRKPALFRQTFLLACQYPAQEISYNKLLGQLKDAGNVDQIKYYLDLFAQAFLIRLVFKWGSNLKTRTSSPKLLPSASVFSSVFAVGEYTSDFKGHIFECLVGNRLCETFKDKVFYWHEGAYELDYVIEYNHQVYGIEVKSGRSLKATSLGQFRSKFKKAKTIIINIENYQKFELDPKNFILENSV